MPFANHKTYTQMLQEAFSKKYAFPAINVSSTETANAAIRGFVEAKSDGIIQVSTGGAEFASGTTVKDMVLGRAADAAWGLSAESDFLLVLEAHRRFEEATQDGRTAAALTLAWAMMRGGTV